MGFSLLFHTRRTHPVAHSSYLLYAALAGGRPKEKKLFASPSVSPSLATAGSLMTTPGALRVRVRHASGLRAADKGGTSDPFVAITLGGLTEKTPVVKKTLNPQFDYDFVFNFEAMSSLEGEQMEVQVYDWDKFSFNDSLGSALVSLNERLHALKAGDRVELEVSLADGQKQPACVFLALSWEASPARLPSPRPPPPPQAGRPPQRQEQGGAGGGTLLVHLSHAARLKAADKNGLSDPYVTVSIGAMSEKTQVFKKTLNPRFDWDFRFRLDSIFAMESESIKMEVFDWDMMSFNDSLGQGSLSLLEHCGALEAGKRVECNLSLNDGQAQPAQLFFRLSWLPRASSRATVSGGAGGAEWRRGAADPPLSRGGAEGGGQERTVGSLCDGVHRRTEREDTGVQENAQPALRLGLPLPLRQLC
jgi:Ca2+-dependent lipid-binding protein